MSQDPWTEHVADEDFVGEQIQVSARGTTVWVFSLDGSTVGRFDKRFGMDVHTSVEQQMAGASQCLHCTHERAGPAEWSEFCSLIDQHFDIKVPHDLIRFD